MGGWGGGGGGGGVQSHFRVKPNSVEVVLRLSWGCDNSYFQVLATGQNRLSNLCMQISSCTGNH